MASSATRPPRSPSRRFLPPSPDVDEPYRLTPQLAFRIALIGGIALAVFAVLLLRLWALQVLSGSSYLQTAQNNQLRTLRLEAARGPILDRSGKVIVTNVAGTAVEIWPADLPKTWPQARDELRRLARVVDVPAETMWKKISQRGADPLTPVLVKQSIRHDQYVFLKERQDEFPGVVVAEHYLRAYPYQSLLAQVLGHVGEIDQQQLQALKRQGYKLGDEIGQGGIEQAYDQYLRGQDGVATLRVDARGRPKSDLVPRTFPDPGNSLRLTIDINLQRAAERALRYGIQLARDDKQYAADGGAIVALDPNDGSLLAMASNPTFQPSIFARHDTRKLKPLLDAKAAQTANYPGLDRATQGIYPPGSTFKPLTAIAAMEAHVMEPYASIPCTPDFKSHGQTFDNWTTAYDRGMTLTEALAVSCDTYFYELGERIWELPKSAGHPLQDWAARLGLGVPTGLDIGGENSGLVQTPAWRRKMYTPKTDPKGWQIDSLWKPGDSIQLAIGQKDIAVTPLQMARFYALIANGGKLVTPHLAEDVEQPGANGSPRKILRSFGARPPVQTNVDPGALHVVQQGLYAATHSTEGTGYGAFGNFPVPIAGKTGTAEKVVDLPGYPAGHVENQSWFCGYGPYDHPELVVCAVIENGGHGGTAAAPAALKVFEQYFGKHGQITPHASD
ncbi:MAG TPA: penicillin-binding protein 2 [Gaiellaceae bacterium]|nr:penicillin-binding protein 2 [Gaiellaceae bacterium]